MANNRIYLRCRTCGNILFLGKCYSDGYYYTNYHNSDLETELNDFYTKHAFCNEPLNKDDIKYIDTPFKKTDSYYNRFEIAYEIEDDIEQEQEKVLDVIKEKALPKQEIDMIKQSENYKQYQIKISWWNYKPFMIPKTEEEFELIKRYLCQSE